MVYDILKKGIHQKSRFKYFLNEKIMKYKKKKKIPEFLKFRIFEARKMKLLVINNML